MEKNTNNRVIECRVKLLDGCWDSRTKTHKNKLSSPLVSWIFMSIITDIHLIEQLQKLMLSSMAVAPIAWTITLTNTTGQFILKFVCLKFILSRASHCNGKLYSFLVPTEQKKTLSLYFIPIILKACEWFSMSLRALFKKYSLISGQFLFIWYC